MDDTTVRPDVILPHHHVSSANENENRTNVSHNEEREDDQQYAENEDYASQYESGSRTLLAWEGIGRPFHHHTKEYYINASLIVLIIEVILFLFSQYVLMLLVLSMLFVVIALAVIPPHTVRYRISTEGIAIDEYFYLWQELYDFYFKHVNGEDILYIRTRDEYSSDITILPGEMPKEHLKSLLINYLPYRETVPLTFIERSGDWLARTFPLDKLPSRS